MNHSPSTLAVLPIQSFLDQPSEEYVADGLTELLISELGHRSPLQIVSMASSLEFKGSESSYQEIGQTLGAEWILDASYMRTDTTLRLRVELHEAGTNSLRWRESYEREITDVYSMLAEIAGAACNSIAAESPFEAGEARKVDPACFDSFLRGLYHWTKSTEEDYKEAIQCHVDSLKGDPQFGPAYERLAACYAYLGFWGHLPLKQVYPRAKLAAEKAIELDHRSVEAHSALALVYWLYDWNLPLAEAALDEALKLNPSHATAHWTRAIVIGSVKERFADALAEMDHVRNIDPRSPMPPTGRGWILYWGRRFDEANQHFTETLEANEDIISAWHGRGLAHLEKHSYDDALIAFNRAFTISADPYSQGLLGLASGRSGAPSDARQKLEDLRERSKQEWIPSLATAWVHLGLGEKDNCLQRLSGAVEERDPQIFWLKTAPMYDPLRSDPRFDDLLRTIGL